MRKFTEEECESIIEIMKKKLEYYPVKKTKHFESLSEKEKEMYNMMSEGISMIIDDPNCLFDNLEKKYHVIGMILFMEFYGNDVSKINVSKCDSKTKKLLDLMVEFGFFNAANTDNKNIN